MRDIAASELNIVQQIVKNTSDAFKHKIQKVHAHAVAVQFAPALELAEGTLQRDLTHKRGDLLSPCLFNSATSEL